MRALGGASRLAAQIIIGPPAPYSRLARGVNWIIKSSASRLSCSSVSGTLYKTPFRTWRGTRRSVKQHRPRFDHTEFLRRARRWRVGKSGWTGYWRWSWKHAVAMYRPASSESEYQRQTERFAEASAMHSRARHRERTGPGTMALVWSTTLYWRPGDAVTRSKLTAAYLDLQRYPTRWALSGCVPLTLQQKQPLAA